MKRFKSEGGESNGGWDQDDPFVGMGLLDLLVILEAYWDLWTRDIRKNAVTLKSKADKIVEESKARAQKIKLPRVNSDNFLSSVTSPNFLPMSDRDILSKHDKERLEKSYREIRQRAETSFKSLQQKWEEEKTVRLRDKVSFFCGVFNVLITALLLGFAPTWIPAWYSSQCALYAPIRVYTYKKRLYHYFLFDLCYAVNGICLVYLWILPGSPYLFVACYGLSMGSLGTAIATWRNSLVFHSLDKVTSLAIHIFPPLVFTTIRHFYPDNVARYPALAQLEHLQKWKAMAINMVAYLVWQTLYYRYVVVARKDKIAEGRATSFTYLINDKRRLIGRIASRVPPQWREQAFMAGQAVYTFVTLLLPIFVLYDSKFWSSAYLLVLFGFSTWTGGSFYLDVFARKFEKELIALRKEFEEQQALISRTSSVSSTPNLPAQNNPITTGGTNADFLGSPEFLALGNNNNNNHGKGQFSLEPVEDDGDKVEELMTESSDDGVMVDADPGVLSERGGEKEGGSGITKALGEIETPV